MDRKSFKSEYIFYFTFLFSSTVVFMCSGEEKSKLPKLWRVQSKSFFMFAFLVPFVFLFFHPSIRLISLFLSPLDFQTFDDPICDESFRFGFCRFIISCIFVLFSFPFLSNLNKLTHNSTHRVKVGAERNGEKISNLEQK